MPWRTFPTICMLKNTGNGILEQLAMSQIFWMELFINCCRGLPIQKLHEACSLQVCFILKWYQLLNGNEHEDNSVLQKWNAYIMVPDGLEGGHGVKYCVQVVFLLFNLCPCLLWFHEVIAVGERVLSLGQEDGPIWNQWSHLKTMIKTFVIRKGWRKFYHLKAWRLN